MHVKIGTRGSQLALWQAYFIEERLRAGGLSTEVVIIETKGDKILDRALSKIGSKGVFTEELEDQLRSGAIDIAVHSAKDLPSELDEAFELIAFTERERVNDVLVSRKADLSLTDDSGFVIGTSSTRRVAMLRHFYPHVSTVDMRGNLQTRLRKLDEGQCDALLLAYAGVHRMQYDNLIVAHLAPENFTPAVGQGSVAIECSVRLASDKKEQLRTLLNHPATEVCLLAERAFLKRLQGGCSVPVFGLATLEGSELHLTGGVVSLDGQELLRVAQSGAAMAAASIGTATAEELLGLGADRILAEIKTKL